LKIHATLKNAVNSAKVLQEHTPSHARLQSTSQNRKRTLKRQEPE
jgi:hypothetical protein